MDLQMSDYEWFSFTFGLAQGTYTKVSSHMFTNCFTSTWAVADYLISFTTYTELPTTFVGMTLFIIDTEKYK